MTVSPALTATQVDIILDALANRQPPDTIRKAVGLPDHIALAILHANDHTRRQCVAAMLVAADRHDHDALTGLHECATAPKDQRAALRAMASLHRGKARDLRKLATQLSKRQMVDQIGSVEIRSAKMVRELARQNATVQTPPTPSGPSPDYWAGKVARHLERAATAKPPFKAPATPAAPTHAGRSLKGFDDRVLDALLQAVPAALQS